jgi:hypothetical protein
MTLFSSSGMGWTRDNPDPRDITLQHAKVSKLIRLSDETARPIPNDVDLREYLPDVRNQQTLHVSSAIACVGMCDYFRTRINGNSEQGSPLFAHIMSQRISGRNNPTGLRYTLKAILRFGLPREEYFPLNEELLHEEPPAFLFSYPAWTNPPLYLRLDRVGAKGSDIVQTVRQFLAAGFVCVCGFPVPNTIHLGPDIPFSPEFDKIVGGQAVLIVGYDDYYVGVSRGAFLIRNSWGTEWGDFGYGWLPYQFVRRHLAVDIWTLFKSKWLDSKTFSIVEKPS